jgi:hypothetical protein
MKFVLTQSLFQDATAGKKIQNNVKSSDPVQNRFIRHTDIWYFRG